jgi:hypothetical protein
MRAASWISASLLLVACGSEEPNCTLPDRCNAVSSASGKCECVDWQVVSDEVVPLKFLVVGVIAGAPGGESQVAVGEYGFYGGGLPADGYSQLGTRIRAVLREANGKVTPIAAEVPFSLASVGWKLLSLGTTAVALGMYGGGYGLAGGPDVKSPATNQVLVWMNPTLRLVRDAGGHIRAVWGWSGNCFDPAATTCTFPAVAFFDRRQLESPPGTFGYFDSFLATLSADERAAIVGYDRLGTTPPPSAAEVAADPRFARIADLTVTPDVLVSPDTTWTPCTSVATDSDFPVYASTEARISTTESVRIEQSWLSTSTACSPQRPGLVVGTSTAGCAISATAYVDRMFGTLAFLTESVSPSCTGD